MQSEQLKALIALRRAHAYKPGQTIQELRGDGPDGGSNPRPNTTIESCDADGVYGEWVVCGTPTTEKVFMFLHGGGYYRGSASASRSIASNLIADAAVLQSNIDWHPSFPFQLRLTTPTRRIAGC
jgi:acetyl esterase/lipase